MADEPQFANARPQVQRDQPTLEEALRLNTADGPRPLTVAEYRARQEKKQLRKHKRSGRRIKLLQQRRLVKEMTQLAKEESARQRYQERLEAIEQELRQSAKTRKRAA
uniref:SD04061p n=1 Tax=Drosophila melanogaster TaxID=7227 RepID=Q95SW0_DROME|nr:SD04061p [Drosophila melanogaster]